MFAIDWSALLADIAHCLGEDDPLRSGQRIPCGTRVLASDLGYPRMTIQGWIDGSVPKHPDGEALIERWCVLTGKERIFAPRARQSLSAAKV